MKELKREIDKPRVSLRSRRGSFYTREFPLDEDEKRLIRAYRNMLPDREAGETLASLSIEQLESVLQKGLELFVVGDVVDWADMIGKKRGKKLNNLRRYGGLDLLKLMGFGPFKVVGFDVVGGKTGHLQKLRLSKQISGGETVLANSVSGIYFKTVGGPKISPKEIRDEILKRIPAAAKLRGS